MSRVHPGRQTRRTLEKPLNDRERTTIARRFSSSSTPKMLSEPERGSAARSVGVAKGEAGVSVGGRWILNVLPLRGSP